MARLALSRNPSCVPACMILGRIALAHRSPAALFWYQRAADLSPGKPNARINLASTALQFDETYLAENALDQIAESARNTIAYHQLRGVLATKNRRYDEALPHFHKALELDPGNEGLELNITQLNLLSVNPAIAGAAHSRLVQMLENPRLRTAALRVLINEAQRRRDTTQTMAWAKELGESPAATLDDRLTYLGVLRQAGDSAAFEQELSSVQSVCGKNPGYTYALITWLNRNNLALRSLEWKNSLDAKLLKEKPVPLALAESYSTLGQWKELGEFTSREDWGDLEFLRLAIQARVLERTEGQQSTTFHNKLDDALIATRGNLNAQAMLARLLEGWEWKQAASEIWWITARQPVGQRQALKILDRLGRETGNTRQMLQVAQRVMELEPDNYAAQNNAAILALLLDTDTDTAVKLAAENLRRFPSHPAFVSTQAFALYKKGQCAESLKILESLSPTDLRTPSIAAYHGLVLAATGHPDKAKSELTYALSRSSELLPEERELARKSLNRIP